MRSVRGAIGSLALVACIGCTDSGAAVAKTSVSSGSGITKVTKLEWKEALDASQPLLRDGRATYVVRKSSVAAISGDGKVASTQKFDSPITTSMTVVSDNVYFGSGASVVATTFPEAEPLWTAKVKGRVQAAPTAAKNLVLVAAKDIVALDRKTGDEVWTFGGEGEFSGAIAVRGNRAYAATSKGTIYALDVEGGQPVWNLPTSSNFEGAAVSVTDDMAFVAGRNGVVWGLFAETGRERWRFDTDGMLSTDVCAKEDRVWVASEAGEIIALNSKTGQEAWRMQELPALVTTPVWANDMVHVGGDDGKIVALAAKDGALKWSFQLDSEPMGPPFVDDGRVWFTDRDGRVYLVD